jgi:sterol desaturase/sphingolipid hydroxylase (fatty acid hydroxylase superfamily)
MKNNFISPAISIVIFVSFFLLLSLMEYFFPLRKKEHSLKSRLAINFTLSLFSFLIAFFVIVPVVKKSLGFTSKEDFGLLYIFRLSPILKGIIAFLLLDLSIFYWHLLNHKIPFLWRFHNVHHIDPDLDASTAFRFHFGEMAMSAVFRMIQITTIGVNMVPYLIYEVCFDANTIFQHSNIRLPIKFERILNKLIVTPRMHGIHHSQVENETNSNFSTVIPWWDWLHNTIRLNIPQKDIVIGVPAYSKEDDNNFWQVLFLPFKKQRDYWKREDGAFPLIKNKDSYNERFKLSE